MAYFTQMIDVVLLGYVANINDPGHKHNPYHWWTRRHLRWEQGWKEGEHDYTRMIQNVYGGGIT